MSEQIEKIQAEYGISAELAAVFATVINNAETPIDHKVDLLLEVNNLLTARAADYASRAGAASAKGQPLEIYEEKMGALETLMRELNDLMIKEMEAMFGNDDEDKNDGGNLPGGVPGRVVEM